MRRRVIRLRGEMRMRRGQEMGRKRSGIEVKRSYDEDHFIINTILKYSKYSWSTWFVMKIWIKLTTYSMLKATNRDAEAYNWISDWGPLVNPFLNYIFWPVSRLVIFFYQQTEPFWNSIYYENILPLYLYHIQHLVEPPFFLLRDISVKIVCFLCETLLSIDLVTVVFIILFLFAFGDITSLYCTLKIRKLYRKLKTEIEQESLECEEEENLRYGKRKFVTRLNRPMLKHEVSNNIDNDCTDSDEETNDFNKPKSKKNLEDIIRKEILKSKKLSKYRLVKKQQQPNILEDEFLKISTRHADENSSVYNDGTNNTSKSNHTETNQSKSAPRTCWTCHQTGSSLLKCSGCMKARYCGDTCYREDWERHREWCKRRGERRQQRGDLKDKRKREEKDEVD